MKRVLEPRVYEWARNNLKVLRDQLGDEAWAEIVDVGVTACDFMVSSVFPQDMFTYDEISRCTEVENRVSRIDDGGYLHLEDNTEVNIVEKSLCIFKALCMFYNQDKVKAALEEVVKAIAKEGLDDGCEEGNH